MSVPTAAEPPVAGPQERQTGRLSLAAALLDAALQAQRAGALSELLRERPRATRWLLRPYRRTLAGAAGLAGNANDQPRLAACLLRWLVTQLRPDSDPGFAPISEPAWLHLSSWRPMLAIACHAGYLPVPDFPRAYRRRSGEAALDNLCGLWGVGPSTVYRTLERARHAMAVTWAEGAPSASLRLSLRQFASHDLGAGPEDADARRAWHCSQIGVAEVAGDSASALWHAWQGADAAAFVRTLLRHAAALAVEPEADALIERVAATPLSPRLLVDLNLARAALARTRHASDRELRALEQARQVAQATHDPLLLGITHSALGKFHEPRDADRAFACYQDSADFLRDLGPEQGDAQALAHFVTTFARLAWLYLLRNDARSKAVLDRAQALREQFPVPDEVLGMLEQVWGEYWRRSSDPARSLEHRFRALNIFERLGDHRSVLAACLNIGFDLAAQGHHERALAYTQRILDAARVGRVEAAVVVGAHLNIGATRFWTEEFDAAIEQYRKALDISLASGLRLHAFRARYNLAEAHYTRFRKRGAATDESQGDAYVAAALAAPGSDSNPSAIDSVRQLKAAVLGEAAVAEPYRLLPGEDAVHFDEMAEVHRQRQLLSVPGDPEAHARAHLAIAHAYLAISTQEREAARHLIDKHGLQATFTAELAGLQQTFARELTREQQLAAAWKQAAADVVDDTRRAGLVAHLLRDGAINKSGYGALCGVAPATASKHLGLLAARGLLVQRGKGPSTRYELPA
jgi:tetratricopeptide (TPR) repeat protein